MKKFSKTAKAFIMASAMAVTLLLPTTTNAQTGMDGFFTNSANETYENRDGGTSFDGLLNASNQTFGENESPLGSGLIIMFAAGAGYALFKKKED